MIAAFAGNAELAVAYRYGAGTYLVARDVHRGAWRTLRVDRMDVSPLLSD